jgi:hypothetical protein
MPDAARCIADQVTTVGGLIDEVLSTVASMSKPDAQLDDRCRTDARLRELLVVLERVRHATEAAQAQVMVAMGEEARHLDAAEYVATEMPARSFEEFVPDEVAVLLWCTKVAASLRYSTALQADRHPALRDAWRAGRIDAHKVTVIAEQLQHLDRPDADNLASTAAEHAAAHTAPQTREWLRRRVIAVNPDAAEERRRRALAERRVVITPAEDGMSELWAWLPSIQARQIQQALTQAAHNIGGDDSRAMDERRADLLVDWLLGKDTPPSVHLQLIASNETVTGTSEAPGWIPGMGPVTAPQVRELTGAVAPAAITVHTLAPANACEAHPGAASASVAVVPYTSDAEPGYRPSVALEQTIRIRDVTCRFPGCRRPALGMHTGTDVDHTIPWPDGPTTAANLAVLCRHHHRLKHSPGWSVVLHSDATMTWTTPTGRDYRSHPWHYNDPDPPLRE